MKARRATAKAGVKAAVKKVPHGFVVEALAPIQPEVRRLFSGFGLYVGDRLLCMVRDSPKQPEDNGVWVVLAEGVSPGDRALRREFPSLREIGLLRSKISHWLVIPSEGETFEEEALRFCERLVERDVRFGRVPNSRR